MDPAREARADPAREARVARVVTLSPKGAWRYAPRWKQTVVGNVWPSTAPTVAGAITTLMPITIAPTVAARVAARVLMDADNYLPMVVPSPKAPPVVAKVVARVPTEAPPVAARVPTEGEEARATTAQMEITRPKVNAKMVTKCKQYAMTIRIVHPMSFLALRSAKTYARTFLLPAVVEKERDQASMAATVPQVVSKNALILALKLVSKLNPTTTMTIPTMGTTVPIPHTAVPKEAPRAAMVPAVATVVPRARPPRAAMVPAAATEVDPTQVPLNLTVQVVATVAPRARPPRAAMVPAVATVAPRARPPRAAMVPAVATDLVTTVPAVATTVHPVPTMNLLAGKSVHASKVHLEVAARVRRAAGSWEAAPRVPKAAAARR